MIASKNVRMFLETCGWGARQVERMPEFQVRDHAEVALEALTKKKGGTKWAYYKMGDDGQMTVKYGAV